MPGLRGVLAIAFLSLSRQGELILACVSGGSFLLACTISLAPISWKIRLGAFFAGPIAGIAALQIFAPRPNCTHDCLEGLVIVVVGGGALAAWVAGFAGVYLVRK